MAEILPGDIPGYVGFPDSLRDTGRAVAVLDMFVGRERFTRDVFRRFVGHIDGAFPYGLVTSERWERRRAFDEAFAARAEMGEKTLRFGRTTVYLADPSLIAVTKPSKYYYPELSAESMTPEQILETFADVMDQTDGTEIIVMPPRQYDLDVLIPAVAERVGSTPHVGYFVTYGDGFEGGYSWRVKQYTPGMPNDMDTHKN